MLTFTLILWLKFSPAATMIYVPKEYHSLALCEKDAAKARKHYTSIYDPKHEYTTGNIIDTFCL